MKLACSLCCLFCFGILLSGAACQVGLSPAAPGTEVPSACRSESKSEVPAALDLDPPDAGAEAEVMDATTGCDPTFDPQSTEPSAPMHLAQWDISAFQTGKPVAPQPGDTCDTWDPSLADRYPPDGDCEPEELLEKWMAVEGISAEDLDAIGCRQLVLVAAAQDDGVVAQATCYQRIENGPWKPVEGLTGLPGWVGANGILHGRRRDSNTSPAGLWGLGTAFGNESQPEGLKIPWRDVTPNTDWVCDAGSIYFNTWQERDDTTLTGTWDYDDVEHLEDYPNAYAYACVTNFNMPPYTVPERGCAIFFHCSKGATGGCIGLSEPDMIRTLLWLDPECHPHILVSGWQKYQAGDFD